jgi:PKD repeat protein
MVLPLRIGYHARYMGFTTGIVRMDWAAQAMTYVAALVDAGYNVAAVNCSWGSSNSGGLDAAVNALQARDVLVVHAAGNSNSTSPDYLGNKAGVMNVAATDSTGAGADFTDSGSWVDVAAPGVDILSTYRNPDDPDPTAHYLALLSGTSMSAPHICGIAALLESCDPSLSRTDKFNLIVGNTTPYSDVRDLGSGIANAYLALTAAECGSNPPVVASFTATPLGGEAPLDVSFTDTSQNGPTTWLWSFGDGDTAQTQHPMHTYTMPDTYTVMLTVTNASSADSLTMADYIVVTPTVSGVGAPAAQALDTWVQPNPFNPSTRIYFQLADPGRVVVDVFDVTGRRVRRLLDRSYGQGLHTADFDGRDDRGQVLASGVYVYRVTSGALTTTRKMVLLK